MKKLLLALPALALLAGCSDSFGWQALPIDNGSPPKCVQIERYHNSLTVNKTWAVGVYCRRNIA